MKKLNFDKYLHIERIIDDDNIEDLHVYIDNKKRKGILYSKKEIDNECFVTHKHIVFDLEKLLEEVF